MNSIHWITNIKKPPKRRLNIVTIFGLLGGQYEFCGVVLLAYVLSVDTVE